MRFFCLDLYPQVVASLYQQGQEQRGDEYHTDTRLKTHSSLKSNFYQKLLPKDKAMKRIILGFLLLAGLGFACEKAEEATLDQSILVKQKKQDIIANFQQLVNLSKQVSTEEVRQLKAFRTEKKNAGEVPHEIISASPTLSSVQSIVNNLSQQVLDLSRYISTSEVHNFLSNELQVKTAENVVQSYCEETLGERIFQIYQDYQQCMLSFRTNCDRILWEIYDIILEEYQNCDQG
jgi:ATP-dependent Lon protease